jgi:nucleotide-binding universal stress UspA family protein
VVGAHAVADDHVAATILRTAEDVHADLVALTTHARGSSRLVIGSTADEVLRGRTGATLVVRPTLPLARG